MAATKTVTKGKGSKGSTKRPAKAAADEEEEDEATPTPTSDELDFEADDEADDTDAESGDDEVDADEDAEEDEDAEGDEDEGASEDAEDEADEPAKPSKGGKSKSKGKAEPADDAGETETEVDYAQGFEVIEAPVDDLRLNGLRTPSDDAVSAMVKAIRAVGLQNPIVITSDGHVIAGNTRVMAYRAMKKKTIPARVAIDPKSGEQLDVKSAIATFATLSEQVSRTDLTSAELANGIDKMLKSGLAESIKDVSVKTGVPQSTLNRATAIYTKGTRQLQSAVEAGQITESAAEKLVSRCSSHAELNKTLETLAKQVDGKIDTGAVNRAAPSKRSGRHGKPGRKPSIAAMSSEALKTEETGLSGELRMVGKDDFVVEVTVAIPTGTVKTFSRFELIRKLQAAIAEVELSDWRTELESCRKRLTE